MFKVENLKYIYKNSNKGIKNISFEIEEGDFIAFIGKNGSGKSTIIKSLVGILNPQEGKIYADDKFEYNDIGYCLQEQSIDWYLNSYQNVKMADYIKNIKEEDSNVDFIIELLDLEDIKEKPTDSISGGQLQRVQVGRALVGNPKLYILDEPTTSLDAIYSKRLFDYMKSEVLKNKACLISSHDLDMLQNYCNKVLFIEDGEINYFGSIENFLKRYTKMESYDLIFEKEDINILEKLKEFGDININKNTVNISLEENKNIYDEIVKNKIYGIKEIKKKENTLKSIFIGGDKYERS